MSSTRSIRLAMVILLMATGCSSLVLRDSDTPLAKTGKVLARFALVFPTLGISEVGIAARSRELAVEDYHQTLLAQVAAGTMSAADAEFLYLLRLEQVESQNAAAAAALAAGFNQAGQSFGNAMRAYQPPAYVPPPRPTSCTTNNIGGTLFTNCY